ncbi:MAG: hypothetical protein KKC28_07065, partial [Verrucomicrobia bacterium]|nr:hypothetical protein [Verrucomicrobiota bacterium]
MVRFSSHYPMYILHFSEIEIGKHRYYGQVHGATQAQKLPDFGMFRILGLHRLELLLWFSPHISQERRSCSYAPDRA